VLRSRTLYKIYENQNRILSSRIGEMGYHGAHEAGEKQRSRDGEGENKTGTVRAGGRTIDK
jgi:hypothetical protein